MALTQFFTFETGQEQLEALQKDSRYAMWLLQGINDQAVPLNIKQVATINFKNFVHRNWEVCSVHR